MASPSLLIVPRATLSWHDSNGASGGGGGGGGVGELGLLQPTANARTINNVQDSKARAWAMVVLKHIYGAHHSTRAVSALSHLGMNS
jgi:hypothetical protein